MNKLSRTVTCPNCSAEVDISTFYQDLIELGLEDGDSSCDEENVTCENCEAEVNVSGSCIVDVHVFIDPPKLISVSEKSVTELSDGSYEVNRKLVTVVDGEIREQYSLPDENQFSLFE